MTTVLAYAWGLAKLFWIGAQVLPCQQLNASYSNYVWGIAAHDCIVGRRLDTNQYQAVSITDADGYACQRWVYVFESGSWQWKQEKRMFLGPCCPLGAVGSSHTYCAIGSGSPAPGPSYP